MDPPLENATTPGGAAYIGSGTYTGVDSSHELRMMVREMNDQDKAAKQRERRLRGPAAATSQRGAFHQLPRSASLTGAFQQQQQQQSMMNVRQKHGLRRNSSAVKSARNTLAAALATDAALASSATSSLSWDGAKEVTDEGRFAEDEEKLIVASLVPDEESHVPIQVAAVVEKEEKKQRCCDFGSAGVRWLCFGSIVVIAAVVVATLVIFCSGGSCGAESDSSSSQSLTYIANKETTAPSVTTATTAPIHDPTPSPSAKVSNMASATTAAPSPSFLPPTTFVEPSVAPALSSITAQPTQRELTENPTFEPTRLATLTPTLTPTKMATPMPTLMPTLRPVSPPTVAPTLQPVQPPTWLPTLQPTTRQPTLLPTMPPTSRPTIRPTSSLSGCTICPDGSTVPFPDKILQLRGALQNFPRTTCAQLEDAAALLDGNGACNTLFDFRCNTLVLAAVAEGMTSCEMAQSQGEYCGCGV